MKTQCNQGSFGFHALGAREVVGRFDGGLITSDGGGLLLRETEQATGIIAQFAGCFTDHRDPDLIEHTALELVAQRIYALALGFEDLNDHDDLRNDPLLAVLVGKKDPLGRDRVRKQDQGKALAGKSTLNRLELTPVRASAASRYKKISADRQAVLRLFTDLFLQSYPTAPKRIVLDLDATDDPIHGHQAGRSRRIPCIKIPVWAQCQTINRAGSRKIGNCIFELARVRVKAVDMPGTVSRFFTRDVQESIVEQ